MKNKIILQLSGIIAGGLLVLFGNLAAVALEGYAPVFLAVGGGVFGISLSKMLYLFQGYLVSRKHPEITRAKGIESRDERNILIREKAGNKANNLTLDLIFILTFIFAFMSLELWVTATMTGLMMINIIVYTLYIKYFQKRL
jgi:hypothetical protein